MSKDYFKLFANCLPVKGAKRSIVCDLQRNQFDFIPNDLFKILKESKPYSELKDTLSEEDSQTLDEYFDFLEKNEYGFWCTEEELHHFPALELSYETPSIITNAIIDVDLYSKHDFRVVYTQLDDLGCKNLQIRFYNKLNTAQISDIIKPLIFSRINSLELIVQHTDGNQESELLDLCRKNLKIVNIIISGHEADKRVLVGVDGFTKLICTKQKLTNCMNCGNIHHLYFVINPQAFTESLQNNSCLNRKIAIDIDGAIKNCPSQQKSYGNVNNTLLKDALLHPDFKSLWDMHKDQIEECMDCEFRHICTDCRAYLSDPNNKYSKPAKCTYDPYTATWQDKRLNVE